MSTVDDRIVNMQFNNKQFQTGAAESTRSLETLEKTIGGMGKGTSGLTSMGSSVDGIKSKFSAMQVAGVTALATIVNKAVNAGIQLAKTFTTGPILDGFREYQTNLNSIQTILANTGLEGEKGLAKVNTALAELNQFSDQTIFNFSQMAKNIGTFTAAGVKMNTAVSAIKGLANTAALTGSSVDQLNTAMYQMSQAVSTGTIRLMDWNSLANAGMGGSNIREALMATNRTLGDHGKEMDKAIKTSGSFRDSLQSGWLNARTFTKTMKVMAGQTTEGGKTIAFTVKQLKEMGFSGDAAKQLHKLSGAAIESATKVKTFSQLIDVVKESIGSGWAKVFQSLFGNFNEATKLWTGVSESITGVVSSIFTNVDEMLVGWRKLGGFQNLWTGFANIFKTISNLIMPFVNAFKTLLPVTGEAGAGLAKLTKGFADVTGFIERLSRHAAVLTPILISLFGVFGKLAGIGGAVIQGLSPIIDLLSSLTSVVGDMVSQGAEIGSNIISGLLQGLDPAAIQAAITTFANNIVLWIKNALGIHSPAAELVPVGISIVQGIAEGIVKSVQFIFSALAQLGGAIVDGMKQLFGGFDALDFAALLNAIFTGGLLLTLLSLTRSLKTFTTGLAGAMDDIRAPFKQMTSTLKTMQQEVRARIVMQIAIAVGILAASIIALGHMDPKKLAIGIGAITTLIGELVGAMALINKKVKPEGIAAIGVAMVLMSGAILTLSAAVAILGNLSMETLAKGLGAMAIALGIMVVAVKGMTGLGKGLPAAAAAILIMSSAMTVLAAAVLAMGSMSLETLAKGLGAIGIGLGIFVIALANLAFVGPGVAAAAAGVYIVAAAMIVMAGAVLALGKMDPKTIAQGLSAMAIGLGIFVLALSALTLMGPGVVAAAAGIAIMSAAMFIMAQAIGALGSMSMGDIAKGLGAIAIGFAILLLAAAAAVTLAPGLIILGVSVALLGAGLALAGAGMLAAATAFSILAVVGGAGIAVLTAGFVAFMALLPQFAIQLAASVVTFIQTIAAAAPKLREAFGKIIENILGTIQDAIPHIQELASELITALIEVITKAIPQLGKLFQTLISTVLGILRKSIPEFVDTGLAIVLGILTGLRKNLPKIIKTGTDLIVALIQGIQKSANRIINAAAESILDFINGLADAIDRYAPQLRAAGLNLARSIIDGLTGGLLSEGISAVTSAVTDLANAAKDKFMSIFGIKSPSTEAHWWGEMIVKGLVKGIKDNIKNAVGATIVFANAVIAAGNSAVAKAQKDAEKKQIAADKASARARISGQLAKAAEKEAKRNPNNKALEKAAEAARKKADKQEKAAQDAQKRADAAAQNVSNVQAFQSADDQGKGDILTARAKILSDRAVKMLAQANAEALAAKKLRGKERKDMLEQAREDAKAAKALADRSKAAQKQAAAFYAKSVNDRIKAIEDAKAAEKKSQADQAEFDAATNEEKVSILQRRAIAAQKRADRAQKLSDALITKAKSLAATDAAKAQTMLDQAEILAQEARDAADEAKQAQEQAQQIADEVNNPDAVNNGTGFQLSRSAMEDAAKAIDRYTESLRQAEEAAQAATPVYQFVQNNNSPESLSDTSIYRQTKNLLSAAEIKMAAPV